MPAGTLRIADTVCLVTVVLPGGDHRLRTADRRIDMTSNCTNSPGGTGDGGGGAGEGGRGDASAKRGGKGCEKESVRPAALMATTAKTRPEKRPGEIVILNTLSLRPHPFFRPAVLPVV